MASEKSSGSQTATVTTEHTLATITDAGTYQLAVDMANLASGDIVEFRAKTKARTGDTTRVCYGPHTFVGDTLGEEVVFLSVPIVSPHELVFTLTQTDGTGRAFPWSVREL